MDSLPQTALIILAYVLGGKINACSPFHLSSAFPAAAATSNLFRGDRSPHQAKTSAVVSRVPLLSDDTAMFSTSASKLTETTQTESDTEEEGLGAWLPLLSIKSMTGLGPQRITVMGIDLVVWHTEADEKKGEKSIWTAQVDACAHRLAPLSQGRVDPKTKCVECP